MNQTKIQVPRIAVAKAKIAQQDAELGRGDGGAGGWGHKFVAAQLLHDEPRHAHADAGTQNGQQTGQPGDDENLQLLKIACQKLARRQIDHTYKQRAAGQDKQQSQENYGRTIRSDTILPFLQYG